MDSKTALPLLLLAVFYLAGTATSAAVKPSSTFIKTSCATVTYPALCEQSLSPFAQTINRSPAELAHTALAVSLKHSQSTQAYLNKLKRFKGLKPRERSAIGDCLEEVSDSLERVSKSIQELKNCDRVKGQEFIWHMSNVQTWVSSALTDENTCMDGFGGRAMEGRIKTSVRAQITNVAHVTSNALALVNSFAQKH
ncbi:21 kDa protein-like [Cynara cardunculus var. scolymus]|uniref:21 kDa protein-like n=1 Tax=Cynara cardunculus var. scolymus TaxID=59895 RepID=UPI000D626EA5|nr:21 kDa protein-like [Cynara cardunculus var. scolymus]